MNEQTQSSGVGSEADYVEFRVAGTKAKGEFRCSECGYGVAIHSSLPLCPMCGGETWEEAAWSPFGRAGDLRLN